MLAVVVFLRFSFFSVIEQEMAWHDILCHDKNIDQLEAFPVVVNTPEN